MQYTIITQKAEHEEFFCDIKGEFFTMDSIYYGLEFPFYAAFVVVEPHEPYKIIAAFKRIEDMTEWVAFPMKCLAKQSCSKRNDNRQVVPECELAPLNLPKNL